MVTYAVISFATLAIGTGSCPGELKIRPFTA